MRKKLIAANWKMHKTPSGAHAFVNDFLPLVAGHERDEIVLCAPYVDLAVTVEAVKGSAVFVGAQNVHWAKEGAFTGEISAHMLEAVGVTHVIIGHSERRQYFAETDDTVNRRLEMALDAGLTPIVCVGEVLEERESGLTDDVLRRQCTRAFSGISAKKAAKMTVAYEPVWAIGTGKTATTQQAQDAHAFIRAQLAKMFDEATAKKVRIQYGGSVKPNNAKELMGQPDVDGALVGGAALEARSFADIIKNSI